MSCWNTVNPCTPFDYRYVKGGKIIVRRAEEGESLTTLDGNVRTLTHNHLVIADDTGPWSGRHHGRRKFRNCLRHRGCGV